MTIAWRQELLRGGFTPGELRRMVRERQLYVVRPGAYVLDAPPSQPEAMHLLQIRAAVRAVAADAVVSHVSAALIHGLPVWAVELARIQLTRTRRYGGRSCGRVHVHSAALDPDEVVEVGGIRVTSRARTVVDLGRYLPLEQAVVVADAALHAHPVTPAELDAARKRSPRRPGSAAARRVLAFADGRSESVGESRSRVAIARAGLPTPVLQHAVRSHRGRELGRVDFWWPQWQLAGEFDGRVKYGRLLRPGQEPGDAVWEEKLREDAIRDTGVAMTRWTWADLNDFTLVARRLWDFAPRRTTSHAAGGV